MTHDDVLAVEGVIDALESMGPASGPDADLRVDRRAREVAALRALLLEAQAPRAPERRFNPTACPQCSPW